MLKFASGPKTPRSMFTLINNNNNQQPDYMDAKMDGLSGDQAPVWLQPRMAQLASVLAGMPDIPNIPTYGSTRLSLRMGRRDCCRKIARADSRGR